MKRQAIGDLVDLLPVPIKAEPGEVERIGLDRRDRGAVVGVVVGGEELAGVYRGPQSTLPGAAERSCELLARRREDQDRLTNQRTIGLAGGVEVALAGEFGIGSDQPARQEAGDVEFLPGREIVAHHDGDLGLEAHGNGSKRERTAAS